MSELVFRESSEEFDSGNSSDDELNLVRKDGQSNQNFKKTIKSTERVDKRLIDQYMIQHNKGQGPLINIQNEDMQDED